MSDTTTPRAVAGGVRQRAAVVAVLLAAALAVLALTGFGGTSAAGHAEHGHEGITTTPIGPRSQFTDDVDAQIRFKLEGQGRQVVNLDDASRITTLEITIPPGGVYPWHTHPGPVLINVAEGEFVYRLASDCLDREYGAGEALIDAGGDNVHTAYNPGDTDTRVIATLLGAPADGPLTIPATGPDPSVCALPEPQAYEAPWLLHPLQ
jgi:quercetin dioxygenase-like cupin family protein